MSPQRGKKTNGPMCKNNGGDFPVVKKVMYIAVQSFEIKTNYFTSGNFGTD